MEELTIEQKKLAFQKKVKVGAAIAAGLCFAPIAAVAIGGLIGLGIAIAIAIAGINLAPVFAEKMANLRMKLILNEAKKNPIETMRNIYVDNCKVIAEKDEKICNFEARLSDYKDKMKDFVKKYPDEASRYQDVAKKMEAVLARQQAKQKLAKRVAQEYNAQISKAEAIYEMACAANSVQQLAGDVEKTVFQDIKKQVAFDSVNHQFNLAVAELSVEADTEADFTLSSTLSQLQDEKAGI